ncbi:STAS domain-containing protein [Nonomuraea sp. NPDC050643]|uniref:STAS domain-containing protein n=1 Tax=Nonomuraea sp. NPDC050643 TaxID=3155660 RepID=UPI0033E0A8BC
MTLVPHPHGLHIAGEIDYGSHHLLAGGLDGAILDGRSDIRLDLSGLTFIDVAGLRLIVTTAARLSPGRRLVLAPLSPMVRRLLALTGWQHAPGLHIP